MVNEILISIAKALKGYTGSVYVDTVSQGANEPFFILKFLKADRISRLSDGYSERVQIKSHFQIVYLANTAAAINSMAETLPFDIKRISVDIDRGQETQTLILNAARTEVHADQDEHTLVCLVDYIYTSVAEEGEADLMLTATINEEVYNGEKQ